MIIVTHNCDIKYLLKGQTYSSSFKMETLKYIPESCRSLSGLLAITEVRFDGIGIDGLCLFCIA